jgi:hypothetical protein
MSSFVPLTSAPLNYTNNKQSNEKSAGENEISLKSTTPTQADQFQENSSLTISQPISILSPLLYNNNNNNNNHNISTSQLSSSLSGVEATSSKERNSPRIEAAQRRRSLPIGVGLESFSLASERTESNENHNNLETNSSNDTNASEIHGPGSNRSNSVSKTHSLSPSPTSSASGTPPNYDSNEENRILKAGYISKKGESTGEQLHRWLVLTTNPATLEIYLNQQETKPETIFIPDSRVEVLSEGFSRALAIAINDKLLYFTAKDEQEYASWLAAFTIFETEVATEEIWKKCGSNLGSSTVRSRSNSNPAIETVKLSGSSENCNNLNSLTPESTPQKSKSKPKHGDYSSLSAGSLNAATTSATIAAPEVPEKQYVHVVGPTNAHNSSLPSSIINNLRGGSATPPPFSTKPRQNSEKSSKTHSDKAKTPEKLQNKVEMSAEEAEEIAKLKKKQTEEKNAAEQRYLKLMKNKMFQKMFNFPPTEELLEDYSCAIKKSILLHGRMYISQHHIAFFSSIFSHKTVIAIPISHILHIQSAAVALLFDNSIKIYVQTGPLPIPVLANDPIDAQLVTRNAAAAALTAQNSKLGESSSNFGEKIPSAATNITAVKEKNKDKSKENGKEVAKEQTEGIELIEKPNFRPLEALKSPNSANSTDTTQNLAKVADSAQAPNSPQAPSVSDLTNIVAAATVNNAGSAAENVAAAAPSTAASEQASSPVVAAATSIPQVSMGNSAGTAAGAAVSSPYFLSSIQTTHGSVVLNPAQIQYLISINHPNIQVHFFASFLMRDHALQLLEGLLKKRITNYFSNNLPPTPAPAPALPLTAQNSQEKAKTTPSSPSSAAQVATAAQATSTSANSSYSAAGKGGLASFSYDLLGKIGVTSAKAAVNSDFGAQKAAAAMIHAAGATHNSNSKENNANAGSSAANLASPPSATPNSGISSSNSAQSTLPSAVPELNFSLPAETSSKPVKSPAGSIVASQNSGEIVDFIDFGSDIPPLDDYLGWESDEIADHILACTSQRFFQLFLSDSAKFSLREFHCTRPETEFRCTPWRENSGNPTTEGQFQRDIAYKMIVPTPVGPPATKVHRTQRYFPQNNGFLVDSSTVTPDITFGDCIFTLERLICCDLEGKPGFCSVKMASGVKFRSKPWRIKPFIGIIKGKTKEDTKKYAESWLSQCENYLERAEYADNSAANNNLNNVNAMMEATLSPEKAASLAPNVALPVISARPATVLPLIPAPTEWNWLRSSISIWLNPHKVDQIMGKVEFLRQQSMAEAFFTLCSSLAMLILCLSVLIPGVFSNSTGLVSFFLLLSVLSLLISINNRQISTEMNVRELRKNVAEMREEIKQIKANNQPLQINENHFS